jgi:hypothetical protein
MYISVLWGCEDESFEGGDGSVPEVGKMGSSCQREREITEPSENRTTSNDGFGYNYTTNL